jgi:hypothetical protein
MKYCHKKYIKSPNFTVLGAGKYIGCLSCDFKGCRFCYISPPMNSYERRELLENLANGKI